MTCKVPASMDAQGAGRDSDPGGRSRLGRSRHSCRGCSPNSRLGISPLVECVLNPGGAPWEKLLLGLRERGELLRAQGSRRTKLVFFFLCYHVFLLKFSSKTLLNYSGALLSNHLI